MNSNFNLKPNEYLNNCNSKDVIAFGSKGVFTIRQLFDSVSSAFDNKIFQIIAESIAQQLERKSDTNSWLENGERCEILKAGSSQWQTGRIRLKINLTLEFITDEPVEEIEPPMLPLETNYQESNGNQSHSKHD